MELFISKDAVRFLGVLILFFSSFCLKFCAAMGTISVNQSITDPASIISSNEAFQLGFFSPVNSTNRYVGIWFNNIPVRTVVWVANRDKPLIDSSGTLTISEDGNLLVLNGQKGIIWSSNVPNPVVNSTAQLSDAGNLVLQDNSNGKTLWESFQNPSDSYLQKMKLGNDTSTHEKTLLKSWKSPYDPSVGSFYTGINPLTIPEVYIWNGSRPYWWSGPWNGQIFIGVPGTSSVYLNGFTLVHDKEGTVYVTYTIADDSLVVYYVLNHDGNLLEKNLIGVTEEWVVSWSSRETECDVYGRCGPFGSCNLMFTPICSCLGGFEPRNIEEWNGGNFANGCVRMMPLQCERNGSSTSDKRDGFLKLTTMKVPEMAGWIFATENECRDQCLNNCSCTAYAYYQGINCMVWSGSLIDIQKFSSDGADLYICVA